MIAELGGSGRCVALDQRGWGRTRVEDGRYDLNAMADDVQAVAVALGLRRYVLVGHSMGGKVAQMVAKREPAGLRGLVLVAPAPPTPMNVSAAQRAAMLESYQTRRGVQQALGVLSASPLPESLREQVIADTLAGHPDAKRSWTEAGMVEDISAGLDAVTIPIEVVVGDRDQVERHDILRASLAPVLPQAHFRILPGIGHLSPLESPAAIAEACASMITRPGATA